jgi:hypothetical protein
VRFQVVSKVGNFWLPPILGGRNKHDEDTLYPAKGTTYLTGTYQVLWDTRGAGRLLSLHRQIIKAVLIVNPVMFEDGSVWKKAP